MTAKRVGYWDYDGEAALSCTACAWEGSGAGNEEHFDELMDVRCPKCNQMLLIVPFPTSEETRLAAEGGNPGAEETRASDVYRAARTKRAKAEALAEPSQLPDLAGSSITIAWDFEEADDEDWTILRHDGVEIWRELAYWEGYERFEEVFDLLHERYGDRLAAVTPTKPSGMYLYGDRLWTIGAVDSLNARLPY